jgi:hypothetical protein
MAKCEQEDNGRQQKISSREANCVFITTPLRSGKRRRCSSLTAAVWRIYAEKKRILKPSACPRMAFGSLEPHRTSRHTKNVAQTNRWDILSFHYKIVACANSHSIISLVRGVSFTALSRRAHPEGCRIFIYIQRVTLLYFVCHIIFFTFGLHFALQSIIFLTIRYVKMS